MQDALAEQQWNDPKSLLQQCCLALRAPGKEPDLPIYKWVQSVNHLSSQSLSQSFNQLVIQPIGQTISQTVCQQVSNLASHAGSHDGCIMPAHSVILQQLSQQLHHTTLHCTNLQNTILSITHSSTSFYTPHNPVRPLQAARLIPHSSFIYRTVSESGPNNTKTFKVAVYFRERRLGIGIGQSIQKAQFDAAKNGLLENTGEYYLLRPACV